MTHPRPQPAKENVLQQPAGANIARAESADACELLFAELEARRVRLRKLLHLVRLQANRVPAMRVPVRPRARCGNVRTRRTA